MLRQKLINEVLDEDRNINRRVVDNIFKQVKLFGEVHKPPDVNKAVSLDDLFTKVDNFAEYISIFCEYIEDGKAIQIGLLVKEYNVIMQKYRMVTQMNNSSKAACEAKIQTLLPLLNSVVVGLDTDIKQNIAKNSFYIPPAANQTNPIKPLQEFCRELTIYAMYLLYRNNIASSNYRTVDITELNHEFNKLVATYPVPVRQNIAVGLLYSPTSAYRGEYKQTIDEVIKKMEDERKRPLTDEEKRAVIERAEAKRDRPLTEKEKRDIIRQMETERERPLTKQERLLVSIRVGGFNEFAPLLSNTEARLLEDAEKAEDEESSESSGEESEDESQNDEQHPPVNVERNPAAMGIVQVRPDRLDPQNVLLEERYARENALQNEQVQGMTGWNDERNDPYPRNVERDEHNRAVDSIIRDVYDRNIPTTRYPEIPPWFNKNQSTREQLRRLLNEPANARLVQMGQRK